MHGPTYRTARPFLVRAPRDPNLPIPPLPDLRDTTPTGAATRSGWLRQAWAVEDLADAVRHASPGLGATIEALVADAKPDAVAVGRAVKSLAGYALRAVQRPTPFGLFAGTAEGRFSDRASATWGNGHTVVASAGAPWMADVVDQLVADPMVRVRVSVIANNVARTGDRLVVPWRRRRPGEEDTTVRGSSLRHTRLVRALLTAAAAPVPYQAAVDKAAAESGCDPARATAVLDLLIEQQAVLTSLTAPTTATDQLGHVRDVLREMGADRGWASGLVGALEDIAAAVTEHNRASSPGRRTLRTQLRERMLPWSASADLALDVRLDAEVTLPRDVAWEAEKAAALLARLSAEPAGTVAWIRYRRRFAARYGPGVLVPVGDLLDPATGLGLPEDFHGTDRAPAEALTGRDAVLVAHAQQAAAEHRDLVLDEALINQLTRNQGRAVRGPATVELKASVRAATRRDLDAGRYTLVIDRTSRGWGHLSGGRFATLLSNDAPAPDGLLSTLTSRPPATDGAVPVQLSFPGLQRSHPIVTTTPRLAPDLISLSEHPAPTDTDRPPIALDDIAVLYDEATDRLYLVRLSSRQVLEPFIPHPLQLEFLTPTIARFLEELERGQDARLTNIPGILPLWDWGAARLLPHLPRVRAGRTVLSPATWDLTHAGLPAPDASDAHWDDALTEVKKRWGIPDRVHVEWYDHRQTLDLNDPAHRAMLREQLDRERPAGRTLLTEAGPADGYGWCEGRPHEIVMLLSSRTQAPPLTSPRTATVARRTDVRMPGASPYVHVRLHTGHTALRSLLTDRLPALAADLGAPPWWVTFDDHQGRADLTIRMPGPEAAAPALHTIGRWAETLAHAGALRDLAFVPYIPRSGIWGAGSLQVAAEDVLAADTACTVHQHTRVSGADPQVLTALNILALAAGLTGSHEAGISWAAQQPKPDAARALNPGLDRAAKQLARTRPFPTMLLELPGGRALEEHFSRREQALASYATQLSEAGRTTDTALHHLIQAHLRIALSTPAERATSWRLARSVALGAIAAKRNEAPSGLIAGAKREIAPTRPPG